MSNGEKEQGIKIGLKNSAFEKLPWKTLNIEVNVL